MCECVLAYCCCLCPDGRRKESKVVGMFIRTNAQRGFLQMRFQIGITLERDRERERVSEREGVGELFSIRMFN